MTASVRQAREEIYQKQRMKRLADKQIVRGLFACAAPAKRAASPLARRYGRRGVWRRRNSKKRSTGAALSVAGHVALARRSSRRLRDGQSARIVVYGLRGVGRHEKRAAPATACSNKQSMTGHRALIWRFKKHCCIAPAKTAGKPGGQRLGADAAPLTTSRCINIAKALSTKAIGENGKQ